MYECFHCGEKSVIWDSDFDYEDYGEEGEGIIHECHCTNCGAQITYRVPIINKAKNIIRVDEFVKHMNNLVEKAKSEGNIDYANVAECVIKLVNEYSDIYGSEEE